LIGAKRVVALRPQGLWRGILALRADALALSDDLGVEQQQGCRDHEFAKDHSQLWLGDPAPLQHRKSANRKQPSKCGGGTANAWCLAMKCADIPNVVVRTMIYCV
jgi:hypothetical protein